MRYIYICVIFIISCFTFSTMAAPKEKKVKVEIPDMEKICEEVNNPKSKYYYPTLIQKYERNDTNNDYR